MEINIPFNEWSRDKLRLGLKTSTARSSVYGHEGDYFFEVKKKFAIKMVWRCPLWFIRDFLFSLEGAETKQEFEKVWCEIHPKKRFMLPNEEFYVHFFEEVEDGTD